MDENKKAIIDLRIKKTAEALERNNFKVYVAEDRNETIEILKTLINKGDTIGLGGSVTLSELGVVELCRSPEYKLFDRYANGMTQEETERVLGQSLLSDVFITSTNAITENGELYNVDGRANRVAAMLFGPRSVVVIAGYNKIVADIAAAEKRVKDVVAPMNCVRLGKKAPCTTSEGCRGCISEECICADRVLMSRQMKKGRVKVILVAEELGY